MNKTEMHLVLADDDMDDCEFFKDALDEISASATLTIVNNGVDLMKFLLALQDNYPDLIFLDLNMPRKSGMECMEEIKSSDNLSHIPIIIFSTSLDGTVVNHLYDLGAHHYIQKPAEFSSLKQVIKKAIGLFKNNTPSRSRETFIIQP